MSAGKGQKFEKKSQDTETLNFYNRNLKKRIASKDGKILAACFVWNLFRILPELTVKTQIDIREVLTYRLVPVLFSLFHVDGSFLHSTKVVLIHHLDPKIVSYHYDL